MKGLGKKTLFIVITSLLMFIGINKLNAASGSISVRSNKSSVVVGNSFNVSVTVSSGSVIGAWEYSINYDSSKVKLMSGESHVVDYGDGSKKSVTYNYTFKSIAKGTSTITVKSYSILAWDESKLSVSAGSATIKSITQEELEASYSKNNNLKSLGVEGYSLTPEFNKDTLEYSLDVSSNTEKVVIYAEREDSTANVSGDGEVSVCEGENKFEIKVTAQNGSEKIYVLKINVKDDNPIETIIDGVNYTVIKRVSSITPLETFEQTTIKIGEVEVPALFSNITNYTLVGLKDSNGNFKYAIYDEENNSYKIYREIKTSSLAIYPMEIEEAPKGFVKTEITINEEKIVAYKYKGSKDFYLVYGVNIENDNKGFFIYDNINNSFAKYDETIIKSLEKKLDNYILIIIVLGAETLVVTMILLISLSKKTRKRNKTIKQMEEEIDRKLEKEDKIIEENKEEKTESIKPKPKTRSKKKKIDDTFLEE